MLVYKLVTSKVKKFSSEILHSINHFKFDPVQVKRSIVIVAAQMSMLRDYFACQLTPH